MNKFSFNRFIAYSKSELASNRRMLLTLLASFFAYIMILFYFNHLGQTDRMGFNAPYSFAGIYVIIGISMMIFCVVYASTAFKKYFHKGYASSALMLPVAQSEKFAFALIFHTIIVPIVLFITALAIANGWAWAVGQPWDYTNTDLRTLLDLATAIYSSISLFFLGAIFFRRHQFLYTLLSLFVINMVFGYLFYLLALLVEWWQPDIIGVREACRDFFKDWSSEKALIVLRTLGEIIGLLFILFIWWLAWIRFRKLQITK